MQFTQAILSTLAVFMSASSEANASALFRRSGLNPTQLVTSIDGLAAQTKQLMTVVTQVRQAGKVAVASNVISEHQLANPFAPVITGFQAITQTATTNTAAMFGQLPMNADDGKRVCSSFHKLVVSQQDLLKSVTDKSRTLESPYVPPVNDALRSWELAVDALASGIVGAVPTCSSQATLDKQIMDTAIVHAECAYTPLGAPRDARC